MNETELQDGVIRLAHALHWRVAHFRPALTAKGWRTPVQADGAGFPDLLMTREGRLLAVELKAKGKPTQPQLEWLEAFAMAGAETAIWRPINWTDGSIKRALTTGG